MGEEVHYPVCWIHLLVKRFDLTSVIDKCNNVMASGKTSEFNLVWSSV